MKSHRLDVYLEMIRWFASSRTCVFVGISVLKFEIFVWNVNINFKAQLVIKLFRSSYVYDFISSKSSVAVKPYVEVGPWPDFFPKTLGCLITTIYIHNNNVKLTQTKFWSRLNYISPDYIFRTLAPLSHMEQLTSNKKRYFLGIIWYIHVVCTIL